MLEEGAGHNAVQGLDIGEALHALGAGCPGRLMLQEPDTGNAMMVCCRGLQSKHTQTRKQNSFLLQYLSSSLNQQSSRLDQLVRENNFKGPDPVLESKNEG